MTKFYPYAVIALTVALIGPVAVDYVAGLTGDVAAHTAAHMVALK